MACVGSIVAGAGEGLDGPGTGLTCLERTGNGEGGQDSCGGGGGELHGWSGEWFACENRGVDW